MKSSNELKDLAAALAKAQAEMQGAIKDSSNPFFKSKYADLESVWEAIRIPLTKNGLSVVQGTEYLPEAGTCVVTRLLHSSGQWIEGVLPIMAIKPEPQAMGSALTYSRRYALAAIAGVVQVDDDAEAAQGRGDQKPKLAAEHSISKVTQPTAPAPDKAACDHRWFTSKYNAQEEYCSKCRVKRAKGAA
jgi:hypothetical protein